MAAETIGEFYQRTREDEDATWPYKMDRSLSYIENRLVCGIKLANLRIFETSNRDLRYKGMGTTIVSTLVSGDKIYVGHVGDSRVYRVREGGITQLTRDHSLLEDYKEAKPDMTEEEERNFPHKNVITRALGMRETVQVDIRSHQIKSGDVYILCSDGLSGMVVDNQIGQIASNAKSLERAVAELVDAANRNGGTDNVTTLLLQCLAA
jgi:protein phosphatase